MLFGMGLYYRSDASLESLETLAGYRGLFSDTDFWRPYVQALCYKHFQVQNCQVRSVLPGTYPTFIAEDRWVVKLFGTLFDGQKSFEKEQEVCRLLKLPPEIPAPELITQGTLLEPDDRWPWPYLIFEYIPSVSIGEIYEQVPFPERLQIVHDLGRITRRIHELPLEGSPVFAESWREYKAFLELQRAKCQDNHQAWGSLPAHLIDQIEDYLLPPDELIDWDRKPHLIHADLTQDHLLGRWDGHGWQTRALIDFGDARVGDLLYELVALHLDLFQMEPRLLHEFMKAYGSSLAEQKDFPRRALNTALLHEFDVFVGLARRRPGLGEIRSLPEVAESIWRKGLSGY